MGDTKCNQKKNKCDKKKKIRKKCKETCCTDKIVPGNSKNRKASGCKKSPCGAVSHARAASAAHHDHPDQQAWWAAGCVRTANYLQDVYCDWPYSLVWVFPPPLFLTLRFVTK